MEGGGGVIQHCHAPRLSGTVFPCVSTVIKGLYGVNGL